MEEDIIYNYTQKVIKEIVKKDDEHTRQVIKDYVRAKYPNKKVRIEFYDEETIDKIIDLGINALNSEKTVHTCLHCGNDTPLYCEKCQQELISKNAELQFENEELNKRLIDKEKDYNHFFDLSINRGVELDNCIPKQVIQDKLEELKENTSKAQGEELLIFDSKLDILKELLEE